MRKLLAALILIFCLATLSHAAETKRVLFISSYHPAFPTFFDQVSGIKSVLDSHDVKLDVEFMDTKRFFETQNYANFTRSLQFKLDHTPPYDVLVVADDNALNYAIRHRNDMFNGMPVVFLGINNEKNGKMAAEDYGWTGVLEAVSIEQTVGLMRHLLPDMRSVVVIADATPSGQSDLKRFKERMTLRADNKYNVIDLSQISWADVPSAIRDIPRSDAILLLAAYRDKNGKTLTFPEGLAIITGNASSPVFHLWKHGMGEGIIGGKIVSFHEHGRLAGELVLKILDGVTPASLSIIPGKDANVITLDWNELVKFHIPEERLPKGTVLENYTPSFMEENKAIVLQLGGLILFLILTISYLFKVNRNKAIAETRALQSKKRYRTYMENAPVGIINFDASGVIHEANRAMAHLTGYSLRQLEGMEIFDLITEDDHNRAHSGLASLMREASRKSVYEIVREDKQTLLVRFNSVRLEDGAMLAFCMDISEEAKTDSALHRIENLFRGLLEQSGDASYVAARNGRLLFANNAACDNLGYSRAEFMLLKMWDIAPMTKATEDQEKLWTRTVTEFETVLHCKDGSALPVNMRTSTVTLSPEEDVLLVTTQDLTALKTEQKRDERRRESTTAYAELFSSLTGTHISPHDIAQRVHDWAKELTDSEYCYVGTIDSPGADLHVLHLTEMSEDCSLNETDFAFKKQGDRFPSLWGESLNTGMSLMTNHPASHPAARGMPKGHVHIEKFLSVPCSYEGEIIGQIGLANPGRDYTMEDQLIVENLAAIYALAIYRSRMEEEVEQMRKERLS